jgi:hypothetical protein
MIFIIISQKIAKLELFPDVFRVKRMQRKTKSNVCYKTTIVRISQRENNSFRGITWAMKGYL